MQKEVLSTSNAALISWSSDCWPLSWKGIDKLQHKERERDRLRLVHSSPYFHNQSDMKPWQTLCKHPATVLPSPAFSSDPFAKTLADLNNNSYKHAGYF